MIFVKKQAVKMKSLESMGAELAEERRALDGKIVKLQKECDDYKTQLERAGGGDGGGDGGGGGSGSKHTDEEYEKLKKMVSGTIDTTLNTIDTQLSHHNNNNDNDDNRS